VTDAERAALILEELGLHTNAIGPIKEWSPSPAGVAQRRHDDFWSLVAHMLPEDEEDERFWMTNDAARQLESN
jgi:hypothetical protein